MPPSLLEKMVFAICRLFAKRLPLRTDPPRAAVLVRLALNALTGGRFANLAFALRAFFLGVPHIEAGAL